MEGVLEDSLWSLAGRAGWRVHPGGFFGGHCDSHREGLFVIYCVAKKVAELELGFIFD